MKLELRGGIADGREIEVPPCAVVVIPELVQPSRFPTDDDKFWLDPFEFVDPELNPHFIDHEYNGQTGEFLRAVERPFVSQHAPLEAT
jgi:hypothetical protein